MVYLSVDEPLGPTSFRSRKASLYRPHTEVCTPLRGGDLALAGSEQTSQPSAPVTDYLAIVMGLTGGVGFALFVFEPVFSRGRPTDRVQYRISDLLWLIAALQWPLTLVIWSQQRNAGYEFRHDRMTSLLGVILVLLIVVALWRASLAILQHRQVRSAWRRGAMIVVAMPLAVCSTVAFAIAWAAFGAGAVEWALSVGLVISPVLAAAVGLTCRWIFQWILRSPAVCSPVDGVGAESSPFDHDRKDDEETSQGDFAK